MKLFKKLFPCKFNNPKCQDSPFGCKCGIVGTTAAIIAGTAAVASSMIAAETQSDAVDSATQLARDQQTQALAEQKRLEEKYGLTPGELAREQRLYGIPEGEEAIKFVTGSLGLEPKLQSELERRAGMTGEELLAEVGPDTKALLDNIAKRQGMTGEELFKSEGAIPTALQEQILADVQNPGGDYVDTLSEQLELARQMVNAEANKRGVFGGTPEGGIRFENLGRAGVDLAVKSATAKETARQQDLANASALSTQFANLSAAARAEAAAASSSALTEQTSARNELQKFLAMMEEQSANAKGRAASVATTASANTANVSNAATQALIEAAGVKATNPLSGGLATIGSIATDYLGDNLATKTASTATDTSSSLDTLRNVNNDYDQWEELYGLTGRSLVDKV